MKTLIKNIAPCERPYEKAKEFGIASLSDAELLAIILRNGTKNMSSIDVANQILNSHLVHKGLVSLNYLIREELIKIPGIGDTKATELLAVAEISNRISNTISKNNIVINNVKTIADFYINKCRFLLHEKTFLMLLGPGNIIIKDICISEGTVNEAHLSAREVFIEALKYNAVNIILVHNHPSGNVQPSKEDIKSTNNIAEAGKIVGIRLLDHLIVGYDDYFSMYERGIIV